jgi:hypothetical protein
VRPTTHTGRRWLTAACAGTAFLTCAGLAGASRLPEPGKAVGGYAATTTLGPGQIVFPIVGRITSWHDDFGESRPIDREQGNDIGTNPGTPVVAAVTGKVERMWWGGAGWTLRLTAANGDQYLYIHLGLNGRPATAYVPGLRTGDRVQQGEQIGWSGYSGNASRSFPHVEFQYLPGGKRPVDPYSLLTAAPHLLFAAPHVRRGASRPQLLLHLTGNVAETWQSGTYTSLHMVVTAATLSTGARVPTSDLVVRVPSTAIVMRNGVMATAADLEPFDGVTAVSAPLAPTVGQLLGAVDAIPLSQLEATATPLPGG